MTGRIFAGRLGFSKPAIISLALFTVLGTADARADEAYLCDGGRIVKVPFGKLEEMKRTDACIAAHYGLSVVAPAGIETGAIPVQERQENSPSAATIFAPSTPAPLAIISGPVVPVARGAPMKTASLDKSPSPRAAAGTDYRNVVLLNPEPGQPAVFHHEQ
jgi:hypothetical protein